MSKELTCRAGLLALAGGLLALPALAVEGPESLYSVLPGAAIIDASSIISAARMDRSATDDGAQGLCINDAIDPAPRSAGQPAKLSKLEIMAEKLKEREQLARNTDKRSQVAKCTQDRRRAFEPVRGLEHYARLLPANTRQLVTAAAAATGAEVNGTPLAPGKASPTCVSSINLSGAGWPTFPGTLTPLDDQLPPVALSEAPVSVIDTACYRRTYPNTPIPADAEVLTVHQYLDRVVESRAMRLRAAGFAPYAASFEDEYRRIKGGKK